MALKIEKWSPEIKLKPNETQRFLTWEELGIRLVRVGGLVDTTWHFTLVAYETKSGTGPFPGSTGSFSGATEAAFGQPRKRKARRKK